MKDHTIKVLVAESNDLSRFIIEKMLKKRGISAITVSNFDAAVYELQRHDFKMVMFDTRLAEVQEAGFMGEMNATLHNLNTYTVALTDGTHTTYTFNWEESGFGEKLEKPVRFDHLDQLLNATIYSESAREFVVAK